MNQIKKITIIQTNNFKDEYTFTKQKLNEYFHVLKLVICGVRALNPDHEENSAARKFFKKTLCSCTWFWGSKENTDHAIGQNIVYAVETSSVHHRSNTASGNYAHSDTVFVYVKADSL